VFDHTFVVGVLEALRMYASWISCLDVADALKCRWTCDNLCFEAVEEVRNKDIVFRIDILTEENHRGEEDEGATC
jgi:hypothetical protein